MASEGGLGARAADGDALYQRGYGRLTIADEQLSTSRNQKTQVKTESTKNELDFYM